MATEIVLEQEYPHSIERVWRALTEPSELSQWLMACDGFEPRVGNRFVLRARPQPGWRGFVECEVTLCEPPSKLAYTWVGNDGQAPMLVTWTLEPTPRGTRLRLCHAGFAGLSGFMLAKLMLGPGWKKMLRRRMPLVLAGAGDARSDCHAA